MPGNKYIELDSSYRNRNIYPLASQFVIPINQATYRTKQAALDPVCDSCPIKVFSESFDLSSTSAAFIAGTILLPEYSGGVPDFYKNCGSQSEFIVQTQTECSQVDDFYVGAMIVTKPISLFTERRRIVRSRYLFQTGGVYYTQVTVESAFSSTINANTDVSIYNPTVGTDAASLFIPAGSCFTNFYRNYYITNQTSNETRKIVYYDHTTRMAQVDQAFTSFNYSDVFVIRNALPYETNVLVSDGTRHTAFLDTTVSYQINDIYRGDYIRFFSDATTRNDIRRVVGYKAYDEDPVTKVRTPVGMITFDPPLDAATTTGTKYEMLQFTRDNAVPFNYTGNELGSQEMVCYDIILINVIIPNKPLSISGGKRLPFYTHVYVEFTNETAPGSGQTGLIYSNNPNSNRMLFRATIDDIASPLNTAFLKFNGDNMVQTIKFKPNDNLRFSVRLHTGEYLQFAESENFSPLPPNPDIQISAIFSINRVIDT